MPETPYAWFGSVQTFLGSPEEEILRELTRFAGETGAPQLFAWDGSLGVLRRELATCLPEAAGFALVLEFELPRSGGRRPDLILLENGTVLVVEFKNRVEAEPADLDQVLGYVRDLELYHSGCHGRRLVPVLVPTGMDREPFEREDVRVIPPRRLGGLILDLATEGGTHRGDARAWVDAPYELLPALVQAARLLFERKPLPRILPDAPAPAGCRDPDDDFVLGCAMAGAADYLVTGDADLLTRGKYKGVSIVGAREFLSVVH